MLLFRISILGKGSANKTVMTKRLRDKIVFIYLLTKIAAKIGSHFAKLSQ